MSSGQGQGQVKLTIDMAIGETSAIESTDKGKMSEIAQKVRDLNGRLQDIRREQVFQRVGPISTNTSGRGFVLTYDFRSVRPNSEISQSLRTREW